MEVHRCRFISHLPAAVVDICPSSTLCAVLRSDSSIDFYQVSNWVLVLSFPGLEAYGSRRVLWLRPDTLVTCGTSGLLCLWQLSSLSPVSETTIPGGAIWGMALGPEDTLALASDDGVLRLYSLTEDAGFSLLKAFHKQPCKMLDVIWPSADTILSCGSDGGIYKWTPRHSTCQLRMSTPACIWRLHSLTEDFIASGDSQGSVTIWEIQYGTLICSLHTHEADILALCFFNDGLYATGVDSKVVQIKETAGTWKVTGKCRGQSHDIYALTAANSVLLSGGVTTDICLYPTDLFDNEGEAVTLHKDNIQYKSKPYRHIPALHLSNYGGSGRRSNGKLILCHYNANHTELWSIDNSANEVAKFAEVLTKGNEPVVTADVSENGKYFAYSTVSYTRIFKIVGKEDLRLESTHLSSGAALCKFGSRGLYFAYKSLKFVDFDNFEEHNLDDFQSLATHLEVRGSTCAVRLFDNTVKIYKDLALKAELPKLETTITAIGLSYSKSLYISTDSNLLLGFSLKTLELDAFSRQYSSKLPKNYLSEFHRVIGIHFFENRKNMLLLHTHYSYTWVDLTRPPPRKSAILPKKHFPDSKLTWTGLLSSHPMHTSKPGSEAMDVDLEVVENFAINKRLGPLLQLHALQDCICAVELPWEEAVSRLPQPLWVHKYGS